MRPDDGNLLPLTVTGRYFELSRVDAERAIALYKTFTKQTDQVVAFLSVARTYENVTRLEIPKIKHAPTSLTKSLEEYLNDKDFDINRRQYLAAQQGRKGTKFESRPFSVTDSETNARASTSSPSKAVNSAPTESRARSASPAKGPAPDLIDFFDSIEQQQQPMAQSVSAVPDHFQQQQMATGFAPQRTGYAPVNNGFDPSMTGNNPFGQYMTQPAAINPQYTGVGFGGYGPQPPQQFVSANGEYQGMQPQQTGMQQMDPQQTAQPQSMAPQSTNPFRQSMLFQQAPTGAAQPQSTNPFNRLSQMPLNGIQEQPAQPAQNSGGFGQTSLQQFSGPQPLQAQRTGTNPFSRAQPQTTGQSQTPQGLTPMVTGSTNPFRQSIFVNQQTGRGWQTGGQGTIGGLEQLDTVAVFPRPGEG